MTHPQIDARMAEWWQFWKWHLHRCRTNYDDTGCWGECIICGRRFGFVTRAELRAYADREIERYRAMKEKAE